MLKLIVFFVVCCYFLDMETTTFGKRLKTAIKAAGKTQKSLSEKLLCAESTISSYVTGAAQPSLETLAILAAECGVSIDWLLTGREPSAAAQAGTAGNETDVKQQIRTAVEQIFSEMEIQTGKLELTEKEIELIQMVRNLPAEKRKNAMIMLRALATEDEPY
ncbi:helix-turn-helix domain-containing protein [Desulfuromonas thiophila]|uniref:helix-turn-helix domain-containing protein n=1 Tax=Desulfuromonas thiophila TaxID=57664 RepID=UPI0029F490B8|nr:helix-turn-helix domain-containing protein [Desulfuromonas thiophila]